jgi:hypothetical protein
MSAPRLRVWLIAASADSPPVETLAVSLIRRDKNHVSDGAVISLEAFVVALGAFSPRVAKPFFPGGESGSADRSGVAEPGGASLDAVFAAAGAVWLTGHLHGVGVEHLLGELDQDEVGDGE